MKRAYEKLCNYTQQCPVTFGVGSISTVKDAMGMLGVKKLFVVYDQGVKMSGLAEKVTKSLDEQGIDYITSNGERELSPSFLRRCLFYYLPFPEPEEMRRIVQLHLKGVDAALLNQGLAAFYWLRSLTTLKKKPSTSELIDWLRALTLTQVSPEQVSEQLPYLGVLLKQKEDLERVFQYHDSRKKYHVS